MNKLKLVAFSLTAAAMIGCGGDGEDVLETVSEDVIQADLAKNLDESKLPDADAAMAMLDKDTEAEAGPLAPGEAPPPPSKPATFGTALEQVEEAGVPTKSPLALMQEAVEFYHSPTERGFERIVEAELAKMDFNTEQAYDRAEAILEAKYMKVAPLPSLDGLVKARILAKIPAAPNGKKWAYDVDTKKVSLQDL